MGTISYSITQTSLTDCLQFTPRPTKKPRTSQSRSISTFSSSRCKNAHAKNFGWFAQGQWWARRTEFGAIVNYQSKSIGHYQAHCTTNHDRTQHCQLFWQAQRNSISKIPLHCLVRHTYKPRINRPLSWMWHFKDQSWTLISDHGSVSSTFTYWTHFCNLREPHK